MPDEKDLANETAAIDESTFINFQRSTNFLAIYSNYVQTAHTAFDLSLTFGETVGLPEKDGKVLVEQKARITLAPLEALVLQRMLNQLIDIYQQRFGQIQIPQDFAGLKKSEGV